MSSCCPQVMEPEHPTVGGQAGVTKKYGQTTLFVAGPAKAKAGLLVFPDIFGPDSGRIKKDAEEIAKLGYAVAVVDVADGEYLTPDRLGEVLSWLRAHPWDESLLPRMRDAIAYLKEEAGVETVSSYGYCGGAWMGARLSAEPDSGVRGHVSFHPSWMAENMLNGEGSVEALARRVLAPQLLMAASNDPDVVSRGGSVEAILKAREPGVAQRSEVLDFPDVVHGWVNRGDLSDAVVKASVDRAWAEARVFLLAVNPPA